MLSQESTENEINWSIGNYMTNAEIEKAFDLKEQLRNVDAVFARVFDTRRAAL